MGKEDYSAIMLNGKVILVERTEELFTDCENNLYNTTPNNGPWICNGCGGVHSINDHSIRYYDIGNDTSFCSECVEIPPVSDLIVAYEEKKIRQSDIDALDIKSLCEGGKLPLSLMEGEFYLDRDGNTWIVGEPFGDEEDDDVCAICGKLMRDAKTCYSLDRGGDSVCEKCVRIANA